MMDANSRINLFVTVGVVLIAIILALGSIWLAIETKAIPEWFSNVISLITGGLIGYLSRDPKHAPVEVELK